MEPKPGEPLTAYTQRCVRELVRDGRIEGQEAVAICQAQWRKHKKGER